MVTKSLAQIITAYKATLNMSKLLLSPRSAMALYRIRKALQEQFDFFSEEEHKRIEMCNGAIADNGVITFPDEEKRKEYSEKYTELLNVSVSLDVEPFAIDFDTVGGKITVDDILALEGLIEIKE